MRTCELILIKRDTFTDIQVFQTPSGVNLLVVRSLHWFRWSLDAGVKQFSSWIVPTRSINCIVTTRQYYRDTMQGPCKLTDQLEYISKASTDCSVWKHLEKERLSYLISNTITQSHLHCKPPPLSDLCSLSQEVKLCKHTAATGKHEARQDFPPLSHIAKWMKRCVNSYCGECKLQHTLLLVLLQCYELLITWSKPTT